MKVKIVLFFSVSVLMTGMTFSCYAQKAEEALKLHASALASASASVERTNTIASQDSLRPVYHVTASSRFINDPNGPVYFAGEYHIFFQHLPFWGDSINNKPVWGHAASKDMVHWYHLSIALAPIPGTYDSEAIASGSCVIHNGIPTIVYTGVNPQTQCLAMSYDSLRTWIKDTANPVLSAPPLLQGLREGFRDPFVWREGNKWRMLVGSAFQNIGGTVLLYESADLHNWEFLGPLCEGMGDLCIQWECPAFFQFGNKQVLIVSPLFSNQPGLRAMVKYSVGDYRDNRFTPGDWKPVDLGGPTVYYAPNCFMDPSGRRILWGWIMADRPPQAGWWGSLSIPRVVTLSADGNLRYEPIPELKKLRFNEQLKQNLTLGRDQEIIIQPAFGLHYEMLMEVEADKLSQVELRIGRSEDGQRFMKLAYDAVKGLLIFGDKEAEFHLNADEKYLTIRLFVDGNIGEAYINGRACFTNVLPFSVNSTGISVLTSGDKARVRNISLWKLNSIWEE
jgi:beta-fructofuranosidase